MYRIKPSSRKRKILTKDDLTKAIEEYRYINYVPLSWKDDNNTTTTTNEIWYRQNKQTGEFYYCQYCMKTKNYSEEEIPKLELISVGRWISKTYCRCVNCGIILCYTCLSKAQVQNQKYLRSNCNTCKNRRIQEAKPTKKCECSPECNYEIPVTNLKGQPQKYAVGHGLKFYHTNNSFKWIDYHAKLEEYERK